MINGTLSNIELFIDGVWRVIACLSSHSENEQIETIDGMNKDVDGWKTMRLNNQSMTLTFDGIYDSSGVANFNKLLEFKRNATLVQWRCVHPETISTGFGYITELSSNSPIDSFITFNGSISVFGSPNYTNV